MASEEEKTAVIGLTGEFHSTEWPWNKLEIATNRKNAVELVKTFGDESEDFITSMLVFRELIMSELISVHGSVDYYDEQDGGTLSAILLTADKFTTEQTASTARSIHDLIMNMDGRIYSPASVEVDCEANIVCDIWFIMSFLEDWCQASGHDDWLTSL